MLLTGEGDFVSSSSSKRRENQNRRLHQQGHRLRGRLQGLLQILRAVNMGDFAVHMSLRAAIV